MIEDGTIVVIFLAILFLSAKLKIKNDF